MAVELDLDAEAFNALAALVDGPHSPVSPWAGVNGTVTDTARARLADLGVVDDTATRRDLQPTLAALAAATATTTVRFVGAGVLVDYIVWASVDHDPVALSATREPGVFRLEDPAPTDRVTEFLTGLVGRSQWRGLDLTLELPIEDSVVLAALIDVQRRRILSGLATGHPEADVPVEFAQLRTTLDEPPTTGFSLVDAIGRLCGVEASRAGAGLTDSIARLAQQGLVDADSEAARPAGPCAPIAEHFAAITAIVELTNAFDDGHGGLNRLGFTCLQTGINDLMTVEWIDRGIHLETVSADTVVGYLNLFLRQPDFARRSAAATTDNQQPEVRTQPVTPDTISTPASTGGDAIEAPPTPPTENHLWRPTHVVPAGGMPAWSAPDPDGTPVARLDPGVELHLLERTGDWAHIICTNGWSAWVDGRTMEEPLTGAPTTPPRSQQVHPTAWSSPDRSRPAPGAAQRVREQPTWRPTHVVPAGGMPAWSAPDPDGAPVARLDPGVELHLLERTGDWAHIVCTNGWSAWVDGRDIQALPR